MTTERELGGNEPCACESGRQYGRCCQPKGIFFYHGADGQIYEKKIISGSDARQVEAALDALKVLNAGDSSGFLFPQGSALRDQMHHVLVGFVKSIGAHPAHVYAVEKTQRLLSEETATRVPDVELAEWHEFVNEYVAKHPEEGRPPTEFLDSVVVRAAIENMMPPGFPKGR